METWPLDDLRGLYLNCTSTVVTERLVLKIPRGSRYSAMTELVPTSMLCMAMEPKIPELHDTWSPGQTNNPAEKEPA